MGIRNIHLCLAAMLFLAAFGCTPIPPINPVQKAQYHTQIGIQFYQKDNLVRAEKELRDALALNDKDERAAVYLALVFYRTGRHAKAEEAALKAASLNPSAGQAHYVIAGCAFQKKDMESAAASARKALALASSPSERSVAEKLLAEIMETGASAAKPKKEGLEAARDLFEKEAWEGADTLLTEFIRMHPRNIRALELHALLLLKKGKIDNAHAIARRVLSIDDVSAVGTYVFGMCLKLRDDMVNAAPLLKKADGLADPRTRALFERWNGMDIIPEVPVDSTAVELVPLTVAVLGFRNDGSAANGADDVDTVAAMLTAALDTVGSFTLIDRARVREVCLANGADDGNAADPETAVRIGAILSCDAVVIGRISRQDKILEADARMIEVATGQALAAAGGRCTPADGIRNMADGMARDLAAKAPRGKEKKKE